MDSGFNNEVSQLIVQLQVGFRSVIQENTFFRSSIHNQESGHTKNKWHSDQSGPHGWSFFGFCSMKPTRSIVTSHGWVAGPSQVTRSIREIKHDDIQQSGRQNKRPHKSDESFEKTKSA